MEAYVPIRNKRERAEVDLQIEDDSPREEAEASALDTIAEGRWRLAGGNQCLQ